MGTSSQQTILNTEQEHIREDQKQTWNEFAPGWKKWDDWVRKFLKPFGDVIIKNLDLKDTHHVLDIATGTGEPGLTIAAIVNKGKVTGQDLSENMLQVAKENAKARGISNFETVACDVSNLPFPDNHFDAISCRMGFMFFPDMSLAAKEMYRVCKKGGRFGVSVWSVPENNFWITAFMGPIMKNMGLTPPPPGAPGMFRCANPEMMKQLFTDAGFTNVKAEIVTEEIEVESFDFFWNYTNDLAAPIVRAMSKADESTRVQIKKEVFDSLAAKYPAGKPIVFRYEAVHIFGEKG